MSSLPAFLMQLLESAGRPEARNSSSDLGRYRCIGADASPPWTERPPAPEDPSVFDDLYCRAS